MGFNRDAWRGGFKQLREDISLGPTLGIAVDYTTKQVHICDIEDVDTDWSLSASTHPTLYIHSATTPASNYIALYHNGTNGIIDVAGTTVLTLGTSAWSSVLPITITQTSAASGAYELRAVSTFTLGTAGVHKAISGEVTYAPSTSGYATPIGVSGIVTLGANFTGGTGYVWGVQGVLGLGTSRTINNAASVLSGLRGVITGTTPVFTDADEICAVYADNLCSTDMEGLASGNSSLFRGHNGGGKMNNFLHVWGSNNIQNFVHLESVAGATPMVSGGGATHSGTIKKIRMLIDEVEYFLTASTTVS